MPSCYRCGDYGHYANQCPEIVCYNCKCTGHTSPNCPESSWGTSRERCFPGIPRYKLWDEDQFPIGLEDHKFHYKGTGQYGASGLPNNENFFNDRPSLYLSKRSAYRDILASGFIKYEKQNNDYGKTKQFFNYHKKKVCDVLILDDGRVHKLPCTIKCCKWLGDAGNWYIHLTINR